MQTSLPGIADQATPNQRHRFQNLIGMLNTQFLLWCWQFVNKNAAAGVDQPCATVGNQHRELSQPTQKWWLPSKISAEKGYSKNQWQVATARHFRHSGPTIAVGNCRGPAYLCRYADDLVCALELESDAQRFYAVLGNRLEKFGLETAPEKTRLIKAKSALNDEPLARSIEHH